MDGFFQRLKQRKLVQWAAAYVAAAFALLQGIDMVANRFEFPSQTVRLVMLAMIVGFFITLVLAWYHGERGAQTVSGTELLILALLLSLGGAFLWRFAGQPVHRAAGPAASPLGHLAIPDKSIAVLPFENLSDEKTNAYFADGIQDEILTRLAKIADLKVISRTSSEQYKSRPGNLSEIAQQLGVAHILEGSVQKAGGAVRINVQLIKAKEDSHLWGETYDRQLVDIFAVETEVAEQIARALAAQLTGGERQRIARVPTANPQAYDAYLRGLALIRRQEISDVKKGRAFMQQAVVLDPLYAQAWAQISIAEAQVYFSSEHTAECLARAQVAAETAVRLQPGLSEARNALGLFYYLCLHDYDRALAELTEAHHLSPNDGDAIFYSGLVKRRQGKLDEAIQSLEQATALDPRNQDVWSNLARSYRGKRDFAAAQAAFIRAFGISPELEFVGDQAECYLAQGDLDAAAKILQGQKVEETTGALGEWVNLLVYRRRFQEAIAAFTQAAAKQTDRSAFQKADDKSWLGTLHLFAHEQAEGRRLLTEAHADLQELQAAGDTNPRIAASLLLSSADLGDRAQVEKEATALLKHTEDDLWMKPEAVAEVAIAWARLGDADRALPLVKQALAASYRRALTPALLQLDPVWDPIRGDPRFRELAGK